MEEEPGGLPPLIGSQTQTQLKQLSTHKLSSAEASENPLQCPKRKKIQVQRRPIPLTECSPPKARDRNSAMTEVGAGG